MQDLWTRANFIAIGKDLWTRANFIAIGNARTGGLTTATESAPPATQRPSQRTSGLPIFATNRDELSPGPVSATESDQHPATRRLSQQTPGLPIIAANRDELSPGPVCVANRLQEAGYVLTAIIGALKDVFTQSAQQITQLLLNIGADAGAIAQAIGNVFNG